MTIRLGGWQSCNCAFIFMKHNMNSLIFINEVNLHLQETFRIFEETPSCLLCVNIELEEQDWFEELNSLHYQYIAHSKINPTSWSWVAVQIICFHQITSVSLCISETFQEPLQWGLTWRRCVGSRARRRRWCWCWCSTWGTWARGRGWRSGHGSLLLLCS